MDRSSSAPMSSGLMESTTYQTSSTRKISFNSAEYLSSIHSRTIQITHATCFRIVRFDYSVSGDRATRFYPEIRKYYPHLKDGSLEAGYAGIRPKISGPMQVPSDFIIQVQHFLATI